MRMRQDCEFQANLGYMARPCHKTKEGRNIVAWSFIVGATALLMFPAYPGDGPLVIQTCLPLVNGGFSRAVVVCAFNSSTQETEDDF